MKRTLVAIAVLLVMSVAAFAQKPAEKATVKMKAKIEAIDRDNRLISLVDKDGDFQTIYVGPEVKRFNELKVGDELNFTYTESIAFDLKKPGEVAPPDGSSDPAIARNASKKPSGSMTQQETVTVTIKAIDPKVPSVTIQTEDGRTTTVKVKDKGKLKDVKAGDRVVITYTQSMLVAVE